MECPFCEKETKTKVVDSRPDGPGGSIYRRRECIECGNRFTTFELRACDLHWSE